MGGGDDQAMDRFIGGILRVGVVVATALVLFGEAVYLVGHGGTRPDLGVLNASPPGLAGVVRAARASPELGLIALGLLVLVATPVARVAFSVLAFAARRDWIYVAVTVVVLALLGMGLAGVGPG